MVPHHVDVLSALVPRQVYALAKHLEEKLAKEVVEIILARDHVDVLLATGAEGLFK